MNNRWTKLSSFLLMAASGTFLAAACSTSEGDADDGSGGSSSASGDGGSSSSGDGGSTGSGSDTCAADCQDFGFETGEVDGENCVCDVPTDDECLLGTDAICVCQESIGETCTDDAYFNIYVNCYQDNDGARAFVTCVASYVDENNAIDCDAAAACDG